MKRISIHPSWTFRSDSGETVDPQLFRLLAAIHDTGQLKAAAPRVDLSYRYAWELVDRWSRFFGSPLVNKARGRGATLTPLGERLLWAEQRSDANLFPLLENVASELNLEIGRALAQSTAVIHLHASHGYAVEKLAPLMASHGHAVVDLQYMASSAALASLCRGDCELAGFHVPIGEQAQLFRAHYEKWLKPRQQKILRLVIRTQGLIVPKGNPRRLRSIADLLAPGLRLVNRQRGSGTQLLLDGLFRSAGLDPRGIAGYDTGEFTHAAVAAYVASGMADVGFGVEPAARQFKLDFVPLVRERYMLACRNVRLRDAPIRELVSLLEGDAFRAMVGPVPGYDLDEPGTLIGMDELFPAA